jgi:hypothetical protein
MNRILRAFAGLALAALVPGDAAAQWNVARFERGGNRLYAGFGLDPALVATLGYGRVVPMFGHPVQLATDIGIGAAGFELSDFRARVQANTAIVRWRSLYLTGNASFITRGTENTIYRGLNFGSDFTGTLGMYRGSWFAAGEIGFDKAIITHITHSDWYRRFYPGAKDGWYLNAGGTFHYGFAAGAALGSIELVGRAGWQRTEDHKDLMPPMYASLGLGVGL